MDLEHGSDDDVEAPPDGDDTHDPTGDATIASAGDQAGDGDSATHQSLWSWNNKGDKLKDGVVPKDAYIQYAEHALPPDRFALLCGQDKSEPLSVHLRAETFKSGKVNGGAANYKKVVGAKRGPSGFVRFGDHKELTKQQLQDDLVRGAARMVTPSGHPSRDLLAKPSTQLTFASTSTGSSKPPSRVPSAWTTSSVSDRHDVNGVLQRNETLRSPGGTTTVVVPVGATPNGGETKDDRRKRLKTNSKKRSRALMLDEQSRVERERNTAQRKEARQLMPDEQSRVERERNTAQRKEARQLWGIEKASEVRQTDAEQHKDKRHKVKMKKVLDERLRTLAEAPLKQDLPSHTLVSSLLCARMTHHRANPITRSLRRAAPMKRRRNRMSSTTS